MAGTKTSRRDAYRLPGTPGTFDAGCHAISAKEFGHMILLSNRCTINDNVKIPGYAQYASIHRNGPYDWGISTRTL